MLILFRRFGYPTLGALDRVPFLRYYKSMKNKESTYVSPSTGVEYGVIAVPQRRMAGGILEGCEMYWKDYTEFRIMREGHGITFCFSEEEIPEAVRRVEYPHPDVSSRFD